MAKTIKALFDIRRDAEMAVERLVQEHKIERTDIFIVAASEENSAGIEPAGADIESGHANMPKDGDPQLGGQIEVSADIEDDDLADKVIASFEEFHAEYLTVE